MIETEENKNCFIITPIGNETGPERRFANGITKAVLRPVLEEFDLKPIVAHEISATGSINDQVIEHIYKDKLTICNLTGLNPNVMYELGVRYSMRKHTILICEKGTDLPFDIVTERTIFYTNDIAGSIDLRDGLIAMIKDIDFDDVPINPVFRALDFDAAMGNIKNEGAEIAILERLQEMIQNNTRNEPTVNPSNFEVAVIERLDGKQFVADDFSKLSRSLLNESGHMVFASQAVWISSNQAFVLKYLTHIPSTQAWDVLNNAISQTFGQNISVNPL